MTITALMRSWTTGRRRVWLERCIDCAAGLALAAALVVTLTGGSVRAGPWLLPVREPWRPAVVAAVLVACRLLMVRLGAAGTGAAHREGPVSDAAIGMLCWCGVATGVLLWTHYQIRFCGGSDSLGYVSAAHAMLNGQLIQQQPIIRWLPFPDALSVATPLGWAPGPSGTAIVPGYPLGLPFVMALFLSAAGPGAEFYVALAAGIALLALSYLLIARLADWRIAAAAAVVIAFNPAVTNMAIQPMSDVPAACWYLLALYVLLAAPAYAAVAGLAAGMAIWTRPSMIFMLPVLLWLIPRSRRGWLMFTAGLAPVGATIVGLQWYLYGSPLRTAYGAPPGLFRLSMVALNVPAYAKWISIIHSPLVFLAFAAGLWRGPRRLVAASAAGLVLGILPYLFKAPYFDDFGLIRYILPALIPCLLVALVGAGDLITRSLPRSAAAAALLVLAAASAAYSYRVASREGAFSGMIRESRYAAVGEWARDHTPPPSVLLADVHSGSLRFYGQRTTLRSDLLPKGALAATVRSLARQGVSCFAALDGEEEEQRFRERFSREFGEVSLDPIARVRDTTIYRLETTR